MKKFWLGVIGLCALGCFDPSSTKSDDETSTSTDTGECPVGTETCACTVGGVCEPGLQCLSGICVMDTTGDGDPTGDGDGDPTGDGDGDPTGDGDGDPTGDGDGDGDCVGAGENGAACTSNCDCATGNCYLVPFIGGQCGECDDVEGDMDCVGITGGGCTPPNPFETTGPTCNMGEPGGGCQTSEVCQDGLVCSTVLDLLSGVITISTCGYCETDADCDGMTICAPLVDVQSFSGVNDCIWFYSLPQDSFCKLDGNGNEACQSGICSVVDIEGIAQIGACGECNSNDDCDGGTCIAGVFDLGGGTLTGSFCM